MALDISSSNMERFDLTHDQREIRQMARSFAADRLAPKAVEWDQEHHFPVDVIREAAELGMAAIYTREDHGGTGLGRLDAAVIIEALGTGCPTIASYISIHNMCTWMVDQFGTEELRGKWIPQLATAEVLGAYCLTEAEAGSDAAALKTRAVADGDDYVLNGEKQFISGASAAGLYIVMARTGGPGPKGITAFLVEDGTPGLSYGKAEAKLGWNAMPTRPVTLEDVRVPKTNMLGEEGGGFKIALGGLNGGRLNIGAASLGGAQTALDKAAAYASERVAFGAPLSKLQTIQFQLADMATDLEAARALLWRAATALDVKDPSATRLCAMAKQFATDAALGVADRAIQIHGGYGCMAEYGVEKIYRDLRVHQVVEGANEVMRLIIARELVAS